MRRADRQVTDPGKIARMIAACDCCRVGFADEGGVYIVPLNFGFVARGALGTLYFHGAKEGRKADLIAARPQVGFEMDCGHTLRAAGRACGYSFSYWSVIGTGVIAPVEQAEEKKQALAAIMSHYAPQQDWEFTDEQADAVSVFRLDIGTLSCKAHE